MHSREPELALNEDQLDQVVGGLYRHIEPKTLRRVVKYGNAKLKKEDNKLYQETYGELSGKFVATLVGAGPRPSPRR